MDFYAPLIRNWVAPLWAWKDKSQHLRYLREFEITQYWKPQRLRGLQWNLLKKIMAHAYQNTIFYRERFEKLGLQPEDIKSFEDYQKLPLLTKKEIQERLPELVAQNIPKEKLVRNSTGGSTGSPLVFYLDQERLDSRLGSTLRHNRWAGWQIGDRVGVLWGARQDFTSLSGLKAKLRNLLLDRQLLLNTFSLTEENLRQFARALIKFKPKIILAYANSIYLFASFVQAEKIAGIRPRAIITSSEVLSLEQRQKIESVFECKIYNRYGCRETSVIASECEKHSGLHLNAETLYVELIREGRPALPGEEGKVVITDLLNYGMPFLRYSIEDTARPLARNCPCGRGLPLIEEVTGRVTDFIVTPDGRLVSGVALVTYLITNIPGLAQVQLVQENKESLLVKMAKNQNYDEKSQLVLEQRIKEFLGREVRVEYRIVEHIPKEPSGKYRFSLSKVAEAYLR